MTTRRPTVVLFDVDGTLITTGGTGRKALQRAFERVHGRPDACAHFSFAGMTDRAIFREGLRAIGADTEPVSIDALLASYLAHLEREVAEAPVYRVHAGIVSALDALYALSHVALGLGTGNVEAGARTKLARVDLNRYFSFGGFGSFFALGSRCFVALGSFFTLSSGCFFSSGFRRRGSSAAATRTGSVRTLKHWLRVCVPAATRRSVCALPGSSPCRNS